MSEWTIDTLREHLDEKFSASEKAVQVALDSAEKARVKAEITVEAKLDDLAEKIDAIERRLDTAEGQAKGISRAWAFLYAVIIIVGVIVAIAVAF